MAVPQTEPTPELGIQVKQGRNVFRLFLKIPICITISMDCSSRDFCIDMIVDMLIFKNNQITISLCFTLIPKLWDYLKQGIVSTELIDILKEMFKKVYFKLISILAQRA